MKRVNRKKASLGASLLSAGISSMFNLFSSIGEANRARVQANNEYLAQKRLLDKQNTLNEYSQKLENQIAEQENQSLYDEIRRTNYKCGGKKIVRKKYIGGGAWNNDAIGNILSGIIGGVTNVITGGINSSTNNDLIDNNMRIEELKFKSNNAGRNYMYGDFNKRMRSYIDGKESDVYGNIADNVKKKNLFAAKQLYL